MNREEALDKTNILIISNNQHDYDEVVEYGFKNVVYFNSIIVADKYFSAHPDDLTKFNVVIKGKQKVQKVCFYGNTDLDHNIDFLPPEVAEIDLYDYGEDTDYCLRFNHESVSTYSMKGILNEYLERLLADHLRCEAISHQEPIIIEKFIMPQIAYPEKKKDLKILFLLSGIIYTNETEKVSQELGVDIAFEEDNNNALGLKVIHNIGDYDIIIASDTYSGNLINMNNEFTEQGKLTGRRLGLVVVYDYASILTQTSDGDYAYDRLGIEVKYKSALGGISAQNKEITTDEYHVLDPHGYLPAESIVERAIIDYHQELKNINQQGLRDVHPESFKHYEEDYQKVEREYEEAKKEYSEKLSLYDQILDASTKYLSYKKKGLIKEPLVDLNIYESERGITIENLTGQRKICTLVLTKNEDNPNRVFYLQSIKENGAPTGLCELSLYPLEKNFNIQRPNEKQMSVLAGLWKKMERNLMPIIDGCSVNILKKSSKKKRRPSYRRHYNY